mmetsp:Transcript_8854/g.16963  ORF Transcript_8854/g.16963 Transcript_8854/m.16963 type:complete len:232 (-) Transcript_8854:58-753(-)|eukprot:scaffold1748_cov164-Amphora_coffeaeformis.AAC.12
MKIPASPTVIVLLSLLACGSHVLVEAWITPSSACKESPICTTFSMTRIHTPSDAERHLDEMQQTWQDLYEREKKIEASNDKAAALELTEEMLKTAIEFVQTKERVERQRALHAHEILQDTLSEERALRAAYSEAHQDALEADDVLESYYTKHLGESFDERRELAISEVSHQVESYVERRLAQVQDRETKFVMDEIDALKSYDDLKHMEEDLTATLEAIRARKLGKQATNVP